MFVEIVRESDAKSNELLEITFSMDINFSIWGNVNDFTREGECSKNWQAKVLDFHVPLYKLLPLSAQLSICLERNFFIVSLLALKYDEAKVGDSVDKSNPLSPHWII